MNIDFPPPSKGTYNNAGSSRRLADYCEHGAGNLYRRFFQSNG